MNWRGSSMPLASYPEGYQRKMWALTHIRRLHQLLICASKAARFRNVSVLGVGIPCMYDFSWQWHLRASVGESSVSTPPDLWLQQPQYFPSRVKAQNFSSICAIGVLPRTLLTNEEMRQPEWHPFDLFCTSSQETQSAVSVVNIGNGWAQAAATSSLAFPTFLGRERQAKSLLVFSMQRLYSLSHCKDLFCRYCSTVVSL